VVEVVEQIMTVLDNQVLQVLVVAVRVVLLVVVQESLELQT
jgi:hypothetical protein